MTISIACQCGKTLRADEAMAGHKGRCPECGCVLIIPLQELDAGPETDEALRACRQAAALRRQWKEPDKVREAEVCFRQIVDRFPDFWMGHYGLGDVLLCRAVGTSDEKLATEGMDELRQAIALAPERHGPRLELACRLIVVDIVEAERIYLAACKYRDGEDELLHPRSWQMNRHWKFALASAEAGLNASSIDAFCRALQFDPHYYTEVVAPRSPKAIHCWELARKKLGMA